jgi:DNA-binding MarR family transcriptional regulator
VARVPRPDRPSAASQQVDPAGVVERSQAAEPETLADTFRAVSRQLRHLTARALAPWDVTPSQSRALGTLARHGAVRLGTLSEHLRIAPRSATEVVDALAEAGLVERRPDPADRRARRVTATERGRERAEALERQLRRAEDHVLGPLPAGDRDTFRALLQRLATAADRQDPVGSMCDVVDELTQEA